MPTLKLRVQLGPDDIFEVDGEFTFPEVLDALRMWVNAIDDTPAAIDAVADKLNAQSDSLAQAVQQNTPAPEPTST